MQYVQYSNGVRLEWDDTISVGTLIRTRHQGYWVLTAIEYLPEPSRNPWLAGSPFDVYPIEWSNKELYGTCPIFHMTQVLREDGTKSKAIKKSCSAKYCSRVTAADAFEMMEHEIRTAREKYNAILPFLPS